MSASPAPSPLLDKISSFPRVSGVYLMKDAKGRIIYVGKAKDLRSRVRQYFSERDERYQIRFLMERVRDVDFLETRTEREALLLENSLIKKHKPKYNLFLKDDKTYLGLKLTLGDDFPRLSETRRVKKDGAAYYGPFTSAESLREVKEFVGRHFKLRTCGDNEFKNRSRPCLEYQIHRCSAPCVGYVGKETYAGQIREVRLFLEGKSRELQNLVRRRIEAAAAAQDFEEAARQRDLLRRMEEILERQRVTRLSADSMDVIALGRDGERAGVAVLEIRGAEIADSRCFVHPSLEDDAACLENFIAQYYAEGTFIPPKIVIPPGLENPGPLAEVLSERAKSPVVIRSPRGGELKDLMELAQRNLTSHFENRARKTADRERTLLQLKEALGLANIPRLIECYDMSHVSGAQAVGSLVTFRDGEAFKDGYRRFKIRREGPPDDYAMMLEVLRRRFAKTDGDWHRPDLVVVDGGKGQLAVALKCLDELGVTGIDVVAVAKGRGAGARAKGLWSGKKEEEIHLPGRKNPLRLKRGGAELQLLQNLRDESHRFAIAYHRKLREEALTRSRLDDVPGIGEKLKIRLLRRFGSPENVFNAGRDELLSVKGIAKTTVDRILQQAAIATELSTASIVSAKAPESALRAKKV